MGTYVRVKVWVETDDPVIAKRVLAKSLDRNGFDTFEWLED